VTSQETKRNQNDLDNESLDEKLLRDFHYNAPIIDESVTDLPSLTKKAEIYISSVLESDDFFRISIVGGGCAGFQYEFSVDNVITEDDVQFNKSPKAYVDSESLKYLRGAEIDWVKDNFTGQMMVNNPGAKMGCGCGSSFMYDFELPTNS